jgi:hypothetical protein
VLRLVLALLAGVPGSSGLAEQAAQFTAAHMDLLARLLQEAAAPGMDVRRACVNVNADAAQIQVRGLSALGLQRGLSALWYQCLPCTHMVLLFYNVNHMLLYVTACYFSCSHTCMGSWR